MPRISRLRETYRLIPFQQVRQSLDAYYGCLIDLAEIIKRERVGPRPAAKAEATEALRQARARLGQAIEGLGFSLDAEEKARLVLVLLADEPAAGGAVGEEANPQEERHYV